jgi:class 3 adenylate cyclase/tetratricopeptide (TPR) repeat protein
VNPGGSRFCNLCGAPLNTSVAAPVRPRGAALAPPAPSTHNPLAGERKQATVLFADTAASMALLIQQDAEEAGRLFDRVLTLMMEAVHRFEGTVHQTLGDGIMAVFGVPVAQEDHAARACFAALRMQETVSAFADEVRRKLGLSVLIRIGLHAGEVVLRPPPEGATEMVSIVGPTVHLASRMEHLATPGTILTTIGTVGHAGPGVRSKAIGPVQVRGVPGTIEVCEITGAGRSVDPGAPRPWACARLVGRAAEMQQLREAFDRARAGPGVLVTIGGEPGIGKTRLVYEFTRECSARGDMSFIAAARSHTRATGHRVDLDVVRAYFGVDPGDGPVETRRRVVEKTAALEPLIEDATSAILWQLGALPDGNPFGKLDHAVRRQRALSAYVDVIRAEAERHPLLIVLENHQWMDWDAQQFVKMMAQQIPSGCLVLVTSRSDDGDPQLPSGVSRVELGPLSAESTAEFLDALLGPAEELASLKRQLGAAAGGNPLFLEETVRDLAQTRALVGEPGRYAPGPVAPQIHASTTVRSVIEARIDRLDAEEKRVLQCAAVIGEQVPRSLLEAVARLPGERMFAVMARLRQGAFLDERPAFPEPCFAFRHTLIHDVAYGSLLHERRRTLHGRVLRILERERDAGRVVPVAELGHHACQAEEWEPAVRYLRLAIGQVRTDAGAHESAVFGERALMAVEHLRDRPDYPGLAIDVRHDLSRALAPLGQHARMLDLLTEAEALAAGLGDRHRLATTLSLICAAHTELGHSAEAYAAAERAVAVADEVGDRDLQGLANHTLGAMARAAGDYRRAAACLRRCLADEPEHVTGAFGLPAAVSVLTRGQLAWTLAELGEFADAVAYAEEAIRLAQAGNVYGKAHAHLGLGGTLFRQGRLGEAMGVLESGLALTRDVPFLGPPMAGDLAVIYALSGRPHAARELGERAVTEGERMGRIGRLSLMVTHLGEVHLLGTRPEAARREAERALHLARERGERGNEVYSLRLLGVARAAATPPDVDGARRDLAEALALAESLEMRPLTARCHLSLGQLERRLGATEVAARHLDRAVSLFRVLDMQFWLARVAQDRLDQLTTATAPPSDRSGY